MHAKLQGIGLVVGVAILIGSAEADDAKLKIYGSHLAQECASCHRPDGANLGIAPIEGWDADRFTTTMKAYQSGEKPNPVMVSVAKSLDDEQLRALALYYASLPRPRPPHAADDAKH